MKEFTSPASNVAIFQSKERHFLEALTRWNYFPNQKDSTPELPPCFSSSRFTPEVAEELSKIKLSKERTTYWFDLVEFRATRFNNVPRTLSLIHPLAYSRIYVKLKEHREEVTRLMKDKNSAVTAEQHNDGRIFIMNYDDHETRTKSTLELSFAAGFRAHADVANCFGSIYTHSLEWAIQGYAEAKERLRVKKGEKHWSSELDAVLRNAKRNETSGLPIGPASSSIAVEIILAAVDRELAGKFRFVRYIDDYTAYCTTHLEAQDFIRSLNIALSRYRLSLNLSKTKITELPEPLVDSWATQLHNALPWKNDSSGALTLYTHDAINFLDYAVHLNRAEPDGSVLKLAAGLICHRAQGSTAATVFDYALNLSWHYPILLPLLEKIDVTSEYYDTDLVVEKFDKILEVNALHRRSDGMCWALYYLKQLKSYPSPENIALVIESGDAAAITLLSGFDAGVDAAVAFANELVQSSTLYELDQYWILLYQLFFHDRIGNPYEDEPTFEILKKYDVQFVNPPARQSKAEDYCFHFSHPFIKKEDRLSFQDYLEKN
ncbi:antiviral reverse transcriptase Drt4 [Pseudomonas aeruginosa]|uniref:antiviral reverse transcriptase Drt4 n=2 Tax=Pseudomonas aeruginosa TaxID=287 RepID=UPI000B0B5F09|nr:antiviral reverse transcriptase Drt4 [Pseudomonas aeruginosa]MCJ1951877.1 RNA-directed DNA polymerase [Pseudomonas aeruginosa]MCK1104496.1 RNA-directed DNA polymerase [Pseudomonas aeruginosa]MCK1177721.1 RNA-directed DNA polymerase [Pseudomonas aeruginosa]MCS8196713.1 RNA-directed DNA polymerase [Pseudomonas aeruginosa]MCS8203095.1 RNA-directed DNA polymerase [Pseudomonas aeruginosa]